MTAKDSDSDKLPKENPKMSSQSKLSCSKDYLEQLNAKGAILLDQNKVGLKDLHALQVLPSNSDSLTNLLTNLVVSGSDQNEDLATVKMSDIQSLVQGLKPENTEVLGTPKHFVQAPQTFGQKSLPADLEGKLTKASKGVKDTFTLEMSLKEANAIHEAHKSELSVHSFLRILLYLVPRDAQSKVAAAATRPVGEVRIADLYEDLQLRYGTVRSHQELLTLINEAEKDVSNFWTYVEKLMSICDMSGDYNEAISDLAVTQFYKLLERFFGSAARLSVKSVMLATGKEDFRTLYRIIRANFKKDWDRPLSRKQVNAIHSWEDPVGADQPTGTGKIDPSPADRQTAINQVQGGPPSGIDANGVRVCFACGSYSHQVESCPVRRQKRLAKGNVGQNFKGNRPPPTRPSKNRSMASTGPRIYCDMPCNIHTSGSHTNKDCILQKDSCNFSASHQSHSQGECRRFISPSQPPPSGQARNRNNRPPQSRNRGPRGPSMRLRQPPVPPQLRYPQNRAGQPMAQTQVHHVYAPFQGTTATAPATFGSAGAKEFLEFLATKESQ